MQPANYNFTIYEGTDFEKLMAFQTDSGTPVDLTGCTFSMQLRETLDSATSEDFSSYVSHNDTGGEITISIPSATTIDLGFSRGVYDLEFTTSTGETHRMLYGKVEILEEVTR